jgi:hypothetical protein
MAWMVALLVAFAVELMAWLVAFAVSVLPSFAVVVSGSVDGVVLDH